MIGEILWHPLLPWPILAGFALAAVLLALASLIGSSGGATGGRRLRSALARLTVAALLLLTLAHPMIVSEQRKAVDDVALVLVDDSLSQSLGERRAQTARALATLKDKLAALPHLEVRVQHFGADGSGGGNAPALGGTRLFAALDQAMAEIPRDRLAGVMVLTDGQIHDAPAHWSLNAPLHVLLTGHPGEQDRRIVIEQAPPFGLVGQTVGVTLRVIDNSPRAQAGGQQATLTITREDEAPQTLSLPVNQSLPIELPIRHAGKNLLEVSVEPGERELTLVNNRVALTVNGIRDRLRVLLISGEPHVGERMWRNLLKSDPAVDLIHFTILRPPEKDDSTPIRELALIPFPVKELFEDKLKSFDLVILDRFQRRGILPFDYYNDLASYVERGGALLTILGQEFNDGLGLWESPLRRILPAGPLVEVEAGPFLPEISDLGSRHPVTDDLSPPVGQEHWGRWFRAVGSTADRGQTLMTGPRGLPLLVLDRVGKGRVAEVLSDTSWLWAKGYEGGGPHVELFRRLAHWLMREPELEEEQLRADIRGDQLLISRRSLGPLPASVTVTFPDGQSQPVALQAPGEGAKNQGLASASLRVDQAGLYRVEDGSRTAIAALGTPDPLEFGDMVATDAVLSPLTDEAGGALRWLSEEGVPDLRLLPGHRERRAGNRLAGRGWLGLAAGGDYVVTGSRQSDLLPPWLWLALGLGGLLLVWWREGK